MNHHRSRNIFILIGGLFFLLLLCGFVLFFALINPHYLKNKIVAQLNAHTGKQWHVDGELHWTLAPQPGLRLKGVTLDDPFDVLPNSAVKADEMDILVDWKTLFSESPQVKSVRLHHATLSWTQTLAQNESPISISISGDVSLDPAVRAFMIENMVIMTENCRLIGRAVGRNMAQSPALDAQFRAAECHLSRPFPGKFNNLRLELHLAHTLTGRISADSLAFDRIQFSGLKSSLFVDQKNIQFSDIQAKTPNGILQANLLIHDFQAIPRYDLRAAVKNIELSDLIQSSVLQGRADLTAQLSASGVSRLTLLKDLNGVVKLSADQGLLNKAILLQPLKDANRFVKTSNQVPFSQLIATANIQGGLLTNHDFSFQARGLNAAGDGTLNLMDESLQYHLLIKTQVKMLSRSFDITAPLKIEGKWPHLMVQLDSH